MKVWVILSAPQEAHQTQLPNASMCPSCLRIFQLKMPPVSFTSPLLIFLQFHAPQFLSVARDSVSSSSPCLSFLKFPTSQFCPVSSSSVSCASASFSSPVPSFLHFSLAQCSLVTSSPVSSSSPRLSFLQLPAP